MSCARDKAAKNLNSTGDRESKGNHLCERELCDQEEVLCCELYGCLLAPAEEELAEEVYAGAEDHQVSAAELFDFAFHFSSSSFLIPYLARISSRLSILQFPAVSHSWKASLVLVAITSGMFWTLCNSFCQNLSPVAGNALENGIVSPCQLSRAVIKCCEDASVAANLESLFHHNSTRASCSDGCVAKSFQL